MINNKGLTDNEVQVLIDWKIECKKFEVIMKEQKIDEIIKEVLLEEMIKRGIVK